MVPKFTVASIIHGHYCISVMKDVTDTDRQGQAHVFFAHAKA
jgi:hypothetical protein